MTTGPIESWSVDLANIGPIYPFVGSETLMFGLCVAFCLWFLVWKFSTETAGYTARTERLRERDALAKALADNPLRDNVHLV